MKSSILSALYTFIFLAPGTITAAPQRLQSEFTHHAEKAGIDSDTLHNLRLYAQYSTASYCPDNYEKVKGDSITCPDNACPLLHNIPDIRILTVFDKVSSAETSGFLIVDHTRRTLTLVFRGSQTPRNSFTSFNCFLIPTPSHCPNCKLHSDFHSAYQHLAPTVHNHLQDLQTLSTRFKTYKLILAGHSLGGALATIAAADLAPRLAPGSLQLYTYGSPRVGNAAFAQHLHSLLGAGNVFRVTHLNDAVPRMPRREWGYAHVGSEFHITSPGFKGALDADREELTEKENLVVREGDVRVLEMPGDAGESEDGVVGYDGGNLGVHHSYFEHVDAASAEGFGAGDFLTFICKFSDDC